MSAITRLKHTFIVRRILGLDWHSTASIGRKFTIISIVTALILCIELGNFYFSMKLMSGIRTWIAAEDTWSKSQKLMSFNLYKYSVTHDEQDYARIFTYLDPYLGDQKARLEMEKPKPDYKVAAKGFIRGGIHPSDNDDAIFLFKWFRDVSFVDEAVYYWSTADTRIEALLKIAEEMHVAVQTLEEANSQSERAKALQRVEDLTEKAILLDEELTDLEHNFAYVLGEGSRAIKFILILVTTILTLILGVIVIYVTRLFRRVVIDAVEAKSDFISITSHQLRSPISQVRCALEMLEKLTLKPVDKEIVEIANSAALKMSDTVEKIQMISQVEHGTAHVHVSEFSLRRTIERVIGLLKEECEKKSLVLDVVCAPNIFLCTDEKLLVEILQNLLSNAYKYTPNEGYVRVRVTKESEAQVRIDITDSGCGIPRKDQRSISRKFFRASNVSQNAKTGTGIGLYMVYSMVHMLNGTISFVSQENKGTTFSLRLPRLPLDSEGE